MEIDIEGIVRKVIDVARSEELKIVAEAVKSLADYMRDGFEKMNKRLEEHSRILQDHSRVLQEHSRILQEHSRILQENSQRLEEHSRVLMKLVEEVGGLKVMIGSFTSRSGLQMEHMVLNLLKKSLLELKGIDVEKIEKKSFRDVGGELLQPGQKVEIDIFISDKHVYVIEVKSLFEDEDVDWIIAKRRFLEKVYGLKASWLIVAFGNLRPSI
ncbi:MAG: microtubule-binding protein [Nitrososphaerota archaeon]|nr:microtubule-binding protein [Nitrososphaerota archaeon]